METIAKVISLSFLITFGSALGITYLYDPGFFESSPESEIASHRPNHESETASRIDLSHYKKRLLEDSQVETQPPKSINPEPERLWTDTYDRSESPEYSPSQEVKKLADENSLNALQEKTSYWYSQYQKALQSGQTQESNYAYTQYKNYKEALEIKNQSHE